jgi:chemotaxis response regulator CheB
VGRGTATEVAACPQGLYSAFGPLTADLPAGNIGFASTDGERPMKKPRAAESFPIVGIGASAGGLEAFSALLKHLPLDTGMGFVLVQHLDPVHDSALTQLLGRATSLPR